jgi:hypothetical protein
MAGQSEGNSWEWRRAFEVPRLGCPKSNLFKKKAKGAQRAFFFEINAPDGSVMSARDAVSIAKSLSRCCMRLMESLWTNQKNRTKKKLNDERSIKSCL